MLWSPKFRQPNTNWLFVFITKMTSIKKVFQPILLISFDGIFEKHLTVFSVNDNGNFWWFSFIIWLILKVILNKTIESRKFCYERLTLGRKNNSNNLEFIRSGSRRIKPRYRGTERENYKPWRSDLMNKYFSFDDFRLYLRLV